MNVEVASIQLQEGSVVLQNNNITVGWITSYIVIRQVMVWYESGK